MSDRVLLELAPRYQRLKEIGDRTSLIGIHERKAIAPYKEDTIAFTSKDNNDNAFYLNAKDEQHAVVFVIYSDALL